MYDNLSDELKGSLELALVIARNCETLPLHFPPIELADNDELGLVLAARGEHYLLNGMSRRIKKRYSSDGAATLIGGAKSMMGKMANDGGHYPLTFLSWAFSC